MVVVSTAAFRARVRGSVPGLGGLKETKYVFEINRLGLTHMICICPVGRGT